MLERALARHGKAQKKEKGKRKISAKNSDGKVVGEVVVNGQEQQIALTSKLSTAYYWKKQ